MDLRGQDRRGENGYAMAALLVALAVMAVLMTAALPAWRHQAQREKEAELVFRGEQWRRAIGLYARKNGGALPPSLDVLVQGRYVRKKYKDPMTEDGEWQTLQAGQQMPTAPGPPQPGGSRGGGTGGTQPGTIGGGRGPQGGPTPTGVGSGFQPGAGGGVLGVISKSKETSIRVYNGGTHYNEWRFVYAGMNNRPGGPGQPNPGGRGGSPRPGTPTQIGPPPPFGAPPATPRPRGGGPGTVSIPGPGRRGGGSPQ